MTLEKPITESEPEISVVIPTLPVNSHEKTVACLDAQSFDAFEVLVVNDASLDICEARNAGIEEAKADIIALTDDDCRPERDWLSNIVDEFGEHSDLICLEGRVEGGRTYEGTRKYVGCNLAFDRSAALSVGGFSSVYAGWRDDTEFGWRMEREAEGDCLYCDRVAMRHPDLPRANINPELEAQFRSEYPDRYKSVITPDTTIGRINDWLWRKGFWDSVNAIRHEEKHDKYSPYRT